MIWIGTEAAFPLRCAPPPYLEPRPLSPGEGPLPRASVLVLDATPGADAALLPLAVAAARQRFPAAPVVLRVPALTPAVIRLAQRAARLRVRAVVAEGEPLAEALRPQLTSPDDLGDDVVEWVELRQGRPLSPAVSTLLRRIVAGAEGGAQLGELLAPLGESERTARHRLRNKELPPPSAWHQMARALHAALRVQAQPGVRLSRLALDLGFSDHSGFSRQLSRAFGVTPPGVRGTLGWEWLVERWVRLHGRDSSGKNGSSSTLAVMDRAG